jgi:hypothetical protein
MVLPSRATPVRTGRNLLPRDQHLPGLQMLLPDLRDQHQAQYRLTIHPQPLPQRGSRFLTMAAPSLYHLCDLREDVTSLFRMRHCWNLAYDPPVLTTRPVLLALITEGTLAPSHMGNHRFSR